MPKRKKFGDLSKRTQQRLRRLHKKGRIIEWLHAKSGDWVPCPERHLFEDFFFYRAQPEGKAK